MKHAHYFYPPWEGQGRNATSHEARAVRSSSSVWMPQVPFRTLSTLVPGLRPMRTSDGRGFAQSLSGSSLRTQGPITPGPKVKKGLCSSAETRGRAVWVPAFAGTTH